MVKPIKFELNIRFSETDDLKVTLSSLEKSLNRIFYFFEKPTNKGKLVIHLVSTRHELENLANNGKALPDWVVGFYNAKKKTIFLRAPSSLRDKSRKYFENLLTHEMAHFMIDNSRQKPLLWLNEGLSLFLGKQYEGDKLNVTEDNIEYFLENALYKNPNMGDFSSRDGYFLSYLLVKKLLKNEGKAALKSYMAVSRKELRKKIDAGKMRRLLTGT